MACLLTGSNEKLYSWYWASAPSSSTTTDCNFVKAVVYKNEDEVIVLENCYEEKEKEDKGFFNKCIFRDFIDSEFAEYQSKLEQQNFAKPTALKRKLFPSQRMDPFIKR